MQMYETHDGSKSTMNPRTVEMAEDIYQSGMTFLRQHIVLTRMSARSTHHVCLHTLYSEHFRQINLGCSFFVHMRRMNVLQWLAKPKIHVVCLGNQHTERERKPLIHHCPDWNSASAVTVICRLRCSIICFEKRVASESWIDLDRTHGWVARLAGKLQIVDMLAMSYLCVGACDRDQGANGRFFHAFADEDAMKWAKLIARKSPRRNLEKGLLRAANLRLGMLKWKTRLLNRQNRWRAGRWEKKRTCAFACFFAGSWEFNSGKSYLEF